MQYCNTSALWPHFFSRTHVYEHCLMTNVGDLSHGCIKEYVCMKVLITYQGPCKDCSCSITPERIDVALTNDSIYCAELNQLFATFWASMCFTDGTYSNSPHQNLVFFAKYTFGPRTCSRSQQLVFGNVTTYSYYHPFGICSHAKS